MHEARTKKMDERSGANFILANGSIDATGAQKGLHRDDFFESAMSQTEGWVLIKKFEPIGAVSLLFRYGENSGDSTHAEAHFRTSCHYQIFF